FLKVGAIMLASPIFWIVAGVIALGVAVYLLIKHWDKVVPFFQALWQATKDVFFNAWESIKEFLLAAWDLIKGVFVKAWEGIKGVFIAVWEWLKGFLADWGPEILMIIAPVFGIPLMIFKHWDTIKEFFAVLWDGVKNVFSSAWDFIKGIVDKIAGAVKKVVGFVGKLNPFKKGGSDEEIPAFAEGGIVNRPTFGMIGEDGPEAVIPLSKPDRASELLNKTGLSGSGGGSSFVFSPTVNIHGNADKTVIDNSLADLKRQFEKWLADREAYQRRTVLT
ncbi:MAG: hypothetical protein FWG20_00700, partial [Candidatus Cloacimonetes bacterium]|nr:hypothetical protein [Candidatus Cloacimonadota bacterium]